MGVLQTMWIQVQSLVQHVWGWFVALLRGQPAPTPTPAPISSPATPTPAPAPAPTPPSPVPPPLTPAGQGPDLTGYRLSLDDEFQGDTLDRSLWSTTYPWGARTIPSNHEAQEYSGQAIHVGNGICQIVAQPASSGGLPYSSGLLTSYNSFSATAGYVEMRAKLPAGKGLWPAFWLLPESQKWPPEIDAFEMLGDDPTKLYLTYHYPGANGSDAQVQSTLQGPDFSQGYHTYGVSWDAQAIVWYVDGKEVFRTPNKLPNEPMYLLVNLAVGGQGSWPGPPDASTVFPASMDIAYIRAYTKQG